MTKLQSGLVDTGLALFGTGVLIMTFSGVWWSGYPTVLLVTGVGLIFTFGYLPKMRTRNLKEKNLG